MRTPHARNPPPPGRPALRERFRPVRAVAWLLLPPVLLSAPATGRADTGETDLGATHRLSTARVDPIVVRPGVLSTTMQVGVPVGLGVESVVLTLPQGALTQNGVPVDTLTLRDNGLDGDGIPNDGFYTARNIGIDRIRGVKGIVEMRFDTPVELHFHDGTVESFRQNLGLGFRYLDASVPNPATTRHAPDVAASARVVSMIPPRLVGGFPNKTFLPDAVARRYYDFFPDDRDFLILEHGFSATGANGQMVTIRNDILGIFDPDVRTVIYDDSAFYGSAGVLQAIMTTWRGTAGLFGLLNHEFLHRWAHYLGMGLYAPGGHGGLVDRPSAGFGGGYHTIEEIAPNTFRSIGKVPGDFHYNDLELYLAGLIPLEEMEWPLRVIMNPVRIDNPPCPPELSPCDIDIWSGELLDMSQGDFLAAFGPRIPDASVSNKNFRSGLVVLYDRLLTDSELAYYEFALEEYEKRSSDADDRFTFHETTGGLATLSTRLFCDDIDGDTVCGDVDNCPTLPNPDQDPEICDQQIVDVTLERGGPDRGGSGVVRWRTTHEVSLTGFDVVRIGPTGRRTVLTVEPVPCEGCDTGEGHEYSAIIPQPRGATHLFIEGRCTDGCVGPWGPARGASPADPSID